MKVVKILNIILAFNFQTLVRTTPLGEITTVEAIQEIGNKLMKLAIDDKRVESHVIQYINNALTNIELELFVVRAPTSPERNTVPFMIEDRINNLIKSVKANEMPILVKRLEEYHKELEKFMKKRKKIVKPKLSADFAEIENQVDGGAVKKGWSNEGFILATGGAFGAGVVAENIHNGRVKKRDEKAAAEAQQLSAFAVPS